MNMTFLFLRRCELIKGGQVNAEQWRGVKLTKMISFCRDQNGHDAGHSDHLHGLRCCLQVRKHPEWSLHAHITQHHHRG